MLNYIKVKDENDTIMWYQKLEFDEENVIKECTEEEYNAYTEIEWHFISLANVDISNLSPWQLQKLKNELKCIKKYIGKKVDKKIYSIDKQLRYIKRRDKK